MSARNKEVRVMVSQAEYDIIQKNARKVNMQVAPYIRHVACDPTILQYDCSAILAHTNEMGKVRTSINRLVYTIDATNNYLPREIFRIVDLMEKLFASENKLLREFRKTWK